MASLSLTGNPSTEHALSSPAPIVWINGFPGVGKLTTARALIGLCGCDKAILVDNHQLIDPVAARFQRDDPEYNGARRRERQKAFDRWITNEAEHERMIIFTDFQSTSELGQAVAAEYLTVANESGRPFIPIYLECEIEENLRRSVSTERKESGTTKLTDAPLIERIVSEYELFVFGVPSELRVDVTRSSPLESATRLLGHIQSVSHIRGMSRGVASSANPTP